MYLSHELVRWSIENLRESCHPFVGITFFASKRASIPIGSTKEIRLDSLTRDHLETYHRLDPDSEFFFQPFKSNKDSYWVASNYPSSGLQAINTQTFAHAFLPRKPRTRSWGFASNYVEAIEKRIAGLGGYGHASIVALAVWLGKELNWADDVDIDSVVRWFRDEYHLSTEEVKGLFDSSIGPPTTAIVEDIVDLKAVAYEFGLPADAPGQTEGALRSIRLSDVGPARELRLDFGQRLTIIAGDNGLGKSFLLDAAWWALTGTWAGHPAFPFVKAGSATPTIEYTMRNVAGRDIATQSRFDRNTYSWISSHDRPSVAALSIYARVDGSLAVSDETRGKLQVGTARHLSSFTARELWDGKPGEIEGLVRDWVTWQLSADRSAFDMLSGLLRHLSPEDLGALIPRDPVRIPGDPRLIPTIGHAYGDVPVIFASAGVQRILLLAYLIIWSWQEHTLASEQAGVPPRRTMMIVVDEIEAHLHPKWQRLVLPALMSIGKLLSNEIEIQIIAATHSPMILASVEHEFSDDSDLLGHLSLRDGVIVLERLDYYRYGDVSAWLTSPVFGLSHARSRTAEIAIEKAKSLQVSEDPPLEKVRQVTAQLKRVLAPDDAFWSRWIYFARQHGDSI